MNLKIGRQPVNNFFDLLGSKEDSLTYAVGYCLANNGPFFQRLLHVLEIQVQNKENITIHLQRHNREDNGQTDIEIYDNETFHIIIEAKKGWNFPSQDQLDKYFTRFDQNRPEIINKLIVLNENNEQYARANFDTNGISYHIEVLSWKDIIEISKNCFFLGANSEKRLIRQLNHYLTKNSTMQSNDSNMVYVVSLGSGYPEDWSISWIDVVLKENKYFHPVGGGRGGWPKEPPNYIAFRYYGQLQSIHHIEHYESIDQPSKYFKDAPQGYTWEQRHYLYELGPAIVPPKVTKSGKKIVRSNRVWAALDLLLTSDTIEEARDKTKLRQGEK